MIIRTAEALPQPLPPVMQHSRKARSMALATLRRLQARRQKLPLKAELARADVSYRELAERLKKHDMKESEASVANKISRGTFPATFFLAALVATGCASVTLEDI